MTRLLRCTIMMVMLTAGASAGARVPSQIDAQGVLRDGAGDLLDVPDATIVFRIYDAATDGALLWSEAQDVPVIMGVFDALLPEDALTELPTNVQEKLAIGAPLWLSVQVDGQAELPRSPLVSVPYAFTANHALTAGTAAGLSCSGCIDASMIDGSAFTAQHLGYAPEADDLVTATSVGGAIAQLDGYVADQSADLLAHKGDPNAHHPADSAGIAIKPSSVTVGTTTLVDGTLDLGPGVDDALTAAQVTTLTAGANADLLHSHTAASISGVGGATCFTMFSASSCPSGYNEMYSGHAATPHGIWSGAHTGSGSTICAQGLSWSTSSGLNSYWYDGGSAYSGARLTCRVCCTNPAAAANAVSCDTSAEYERASGGDYMGSTNAYGTLVPTTSATFTIGVQNRDYHFSRIEVAVPAPAITGAWPTSAGAVSSMDLELLAADGTAVLASAPLVRGSGSFTTSYYRGYGQNPPITVYLFEAKIDLAYAGNTPIRLRARNVASGAEGPGLYVDDRFLNNCSGAACESAPWFHIYGCLQ